MRINLIEYLNLLNNLEEEFKDIEPNLAAKVEKYLSRAGEFFHDTEDKVVKSNYANVVDYILKLNSRSTETSSISF